MDAARRGGPAVRPPITHPPGRPPSRPQAATSAPLIERSIERATGIVYNITGGKDLTLQVGSWLGRLCFGLCV